MHNRIREIALMKKIKRVNIERKAKISHKHLYDIINGKKIPSLRIAQEIAKALDSSIDEVFPDKVS